MSWKHKYRLNEHNSININHLKHEKCARRHNATCFSGIFWITAFKVCSLFIRWRKFSSCHYKIVKFWRFRIGFSYSFFFVFRIFRSFCIFSIILRFNDIHFWWQSSLSSFHLFSSSFPVKIEMQFWIYEYLSLKKINSSIKFFLKLNTSMNHFFMFSVNYFHIEILTM